MADEMHEDRREVTVFVTVVDEATNESHEQDQQIESGASKVEVIKEELGVPAASALWVLGGDGRSHQLADHRDHDVREGDHFEVIVRGGIS